MCCEEQPTAVSQGAPQSGAWPALYQEEFVKALAARPGEAILQRQRAVAKQRGQKKKKPSAADSDEANDRLPSTGCTSAGSGAGKCKQAAGSGSPDVPAAKRAAACSAGCEGHAPAGKAAKPSGKAAKPAGKAAKPVGEAAEPAGEAAEPASNETPGPASSSGAGSCPAGDPALGIGTVRLPPGAQRPPGAASGRYSWTLHCPHDAQPTSTIIGRICVMPKRTAFYVKPVDVNVIHALDGPGMLNVDKAGGVYVAWGVDVNKAWGIARWAAGWGA